MQKRAVLQTQSIDKNGLFLFPVVPTGSHILCSAFELSLCGDSLSLCDWIRTSYTDYSDAYCVVKNQYGKCVEWHFLNIFMPLFYDGAY